MAEEGRSAMRGGFEAGQVWAADFGCFGTRTCFSPNDTANCPIDGPGTLRNIALRLELAETKVRYGLTTRNYSLLGIILILTEKRQDRRSVRNGDF